MSIDAPLFITCTDHDCYDCAEGGSSGRHAIRCACGQDAVEVLSADDGDARFTIGYCRSCLDLIESDAVPLVKRRWPLSVTRRGEHPAFCSVPCTECGAPVAASDPADIDQCSPACGRQAEERYRWDTREVRS